METYLRLKDVLESGQRPSFWVWTSGSGGGRHSSPSGLSLTGGALAGTSAGEGDGEAPHPGDPRSAPDTVWTSVSWDATPDRAGSARCSRRPLPKDSSPALRPLLSPRLYSGCFLCSPQAAAARASQAPAYHQAFRRFWKPKGRALHRPSQMSPELSLLLRGPHSPSRLQCLQPRNCHGLRALESTLPALGPSLAPRGETRCRRLGGGVMLGLQQRSQRRGGGGKDRSRGRAQREAPESGRPSRREPLCPGSLPEAALGLW